MAARALLNVLALLAALHLSSPRLLCVQCSYGRNEETEECIRGRLAPSPCPLANHTHCVTHKSSDPDTREVAVLWRRCGFEAELACTTHRMGNDLSATDQAWASDTRRSTRDHLPQVKVCIIGCREDGCNGVGVGAAALPLVFLSALLSLATSS